MRIVIYLLFALSLLTSYRQGNASDQMPTAQEATHIYAYPAQYTPEDWLGAAIFYVYKKDFKKAAELCVWAVARTGIDVRLIRAPDLQDMPSCFMEIVFDHMEDAGWSQDDFQAFLAEKKAALATFPEWDKKHPRSYPLARDDRLPPLTKKQEEQIVQRIYREISSVGDDGLIPIEGDDFAAEKDDRAFFEKTTRAYFLHGDGDSLTFRVPTSIIPLLGEFGKYNGKFMITAKGRIFIGTSWSLNEPDWESEVQFCSSCERGENYMEGSKEEAETSEDYNYKEWDHRLTFPEWKKNFKTLHFQFLKRDNQQVQVIHMIKILKSHTIYSFRLETTKEHQDECLKLFKEMIVSVH